MKLLNSSLLYFCLLGVALPGKLQAQQTNVQPSENKLRELKAISKDLFCAFFEDLSYAADGGLYAELVQNRSFEYNPADRKEWNPLSFWEYTTQGHGYGKISVESASPIAPTN